MARDCPEAQSQDKPFERKKGPRVCFKCQKEGHMSRECPGLGEAQMEDENANNRVENSRPKRRRSVSRSGSGSPPRVSKDQHSRIDEPQEQPPSDQEPKLFVTSLADETTEDDLIKVFQVHGEIVDVYIKSNDRGKFAFVTFSSLEEAENAKQ